MGRVFFGGGKVDMRAPLSLPSGYTKLAYIQSSGTQYIDPGVNVSPANYTKLRVVADLYFSNVSAMNYLGVSNDIVKFWFGTYGGTIWCADGNTNLNTSVAYDGARHTFDLNGKAKTFSVSGTSAAFSGMAMSSPTGTGAFIIPASSPSMTLYSCQIYEDDVLIRDFVPCISDSGAVGLYDLVNRQFYGNAGSGTFTGSEVA